MNTLLLVQDAWDVCLDSSGNWAMATAPYALAQDTASAVKTFLGEIYYNTLLGIPYFTQVLGYNPPASLLAGFIEQQALTVPTIMTSSFTITGFNNREVTGQVVSTDSSGQTITVPISGGL
jgi:hypothetical protein